MPGSKVRLLFCYVESLPFPTLPLIKISERSSMTRERIYLYDDRGGRNHVTGVEQEITLGRPGGRVV